MAAEEFFRPFSALLLPFNKCCLSMTECLLCCWLTAELSAGGFLRNYVSWWWRATKARSIWHHWISFSCVMDCLQRFKFCWFKRAQLCTQVHHALPELLTAWPVHVDSSSDVRSCCCVECLKVSTRILVSPVKEYTNVIRSFSFLKG